MRYVSTRSCTIAAAATSTGDVTGTTVSLSDAILAGMAADGGLYMPVEMPQIPIVAFDHCPTLAETATVLLTPFFAGDALASVLGDICSEAFTFDAPLRPLASPHDSLLELFHGPTAAFKDFGARFLASAMARIVDCESAAHGRDNTCDSNSHNGDNRGAFNRGVRTILVATSGDTGAAVAAAFAGRTGYRVVILYPDARVSLRQAHQLGSFGGNVKALRTAGSFDDCQRLVKEAFADKALNGMVHLSSANSISLGRLLPQMAYYAHAALINHRANGTALNFVVPTGNLGNAVACIMARGCGLPIGKVVLATNANHTLADFFSGKNYTPRASVATLANAMDVGAPSNFERLQWLYPDSDTLRREFQVVVVGDSVIRETISRSYSAHGDTFCPHTATAIHALEILRARGETGDWAAVATAHPAKFEAIVEPLIGRQVAVPEQLQAMLARPDSAEPLAAEYTALRDYLIDHSGH